MLMSNEHLQKITIAFAFVLNCAQAMPGLFTPKAVKALGEMEMVELDHGYRFSSLLDGPKDSTLKGQGYLATIKESASERNLMRPFVAETEHYVPHNPPTGPGACHVFAATAVVLDSTGLLLSNADLFLQQMMKDGAAIDTTVKQINTMRKMPVPAKCLAGVSERYEHWEGGNLKTNLETLQRKGGVIVPYESKWDKVISLVNHLKFTQASLAAQPTARQVTREELQTRLNIDGFQKILESVTKEGVASTGSGRVAASRDMVRRVVKNLKVRKLKLAVPSRFFEASTTRQQRIDGLIFKRKEYLLEHLQRRAIYGAVDWETFGKAIEGKVPKGETVFLDEMQASHAIAIVGYLTDSDVFFVRDSNFAYTVAIDADQLVQSLTSAYILV